MISSLIFAGALPLHAQQWVRSYRNARRMAIRQNKKLFIFFSGSDWCTESRQLAGTLLRSRSFLKLVREKYILYNADFPRYKVLGQEAAESNRRLASRYRITQYPAIVLVEPRHGGLLVKHVSIRELGGKELLETLEKAAGIRKKTVKK